MPLRAKLTVIVAGMLAMVSLMVTDQATSALPDEQLIVFVQSGKSPVDRAFQESRLPEIRRLAEQMKVSVSVLEANDGAPGEVAITPLIIYQNFRGRSIYQGRTTTLSRVRNFIRTSRFVPQGEEPLQRQQIPVWKNGRTRTWAPIKISRVTGTIPPGYDHEAFLKEAQRGLARGFKKFRYQDAVDLNRADRGFYMDFYPWRADDGTLFLSLALYSQFHCKEPVFELKKQPIVGSWKDRKKMFTKAAAIMEREVVKRTQDPDGGDGFDPVSRRTREATWNALGFPLPSAPRASQQSLSPVSGKIPTSWILDPPGPDNPPMIQLRFPAPLDQYTGEVTRGSGKLALSENRLAEGMTGYVEIDPTSVTMGEPTLDEALQGSMFLYSRKFKTAAFLIESVQGEADPIGWGRLTPAGMAGVFKLKGVSRPMTLPVEIEPIVGTDGKPRLLVRGAFQIDLTEFDIEGADGPAPARNTLLVDVNLMFRPR
ncbi:hypothetical protein D3OALGA1CA_3054 [Olavius algarvensis associated proteobacterium Delta 3]|nr:hypothetical protein D3OALGA1CA_3054 [Olavius algarvensis associated proteobacterium Delta 3]CAB5157965.1 hypothetical protein D3OALGB2SA_5235 [Olavius algarvensis associated proteobacterium Delta 3]